MPTTVSMPAPQGARQSAGSGLHDVEHSKSPGKSGGFSFPHNPGAKPGDTMQAHGHTYVLAGSPPRWHRQDKEQGTGSGGQGTGDTAQPEERSPQRAAAIANPDFVDHGKRHGFTRAAMRQVHPAARGIMSAMHASPDVQAGGAYTTMDFAPEQAGGLYQWLQQNAGQDTGGGKALDVGQGRYAFASPAGAVVVWPADASGQHKVSYTNKTGVVADAMRGGQPPVDPRNVESQPGAPPAGGRHQPGFEPSQATSEQLAAAGAMTEKPGRKPREGGPQTPREIADATKQRIADATRQWDEELAGGLSTKGNARWRSYLAALNSIHGHQDKLAREEERKSKGSTSGKGQESGDAKTGHDLTAEEQAAAANSQQAFDELRAMREGIGESAYQDGVKQLAGQGKPWERRDSVDSPPIKGGAREQEAMTRLGAKPTTPEERQTHVNRLEQHYKDLEQGKHLEKPVDQPVATQEPAVQPAEFETPPQEQPKPAAKPEKEKKPRPSGAEKLLGLSGKYLDHFQVNASDKNKAAIEQAITTGRVKNPAELRRLLATARKIHERGNVADDDHPALQEALRRKANREGRETWKEHVKRQSEAWDMEPGEYESLAKELHGEFSKHHAEREAARQAARKSTGLSAADINRLENQGFDSGSEHPRIKNLDAVGRELAAQYPALGWGRGREDDSDDGVDYGERLWALIREGRQAIPGRQSPEFLQHVEDFLQSQLKSASSGGPGAVADDDGLSSVPFAKVRDGIVQRYAKWLEEEHPRGQPHNPGQFRDKDAGDGESKHHRRLLRKTLDALINANIDTAASLKFERAATEAIRLLPNSWIHRLNRDVESVHFYSNLDDLNRELQRRQNGAPESVAFFDPDDGSVHLNGADEEENDHDDLVEAYIHEFAHGIDRNDRFADAGEWEGIWFAEIAHGKLNENADRDHFEGWSEYGTMVLADPVQARKFREAWRFWSEKGLTR